MDHSEFSGMTRLTAPEIETRLREIAVGRIATHDQASGESSLTPLLFGYADRRIYFSTQPGRKLTLLRRYPQGVGLQCDAQHDDVWTTILVWGCYRDVPPGIEFGRALRLLAQKYGPRFIDQLRQQAIKAFRGGPVGVIEAVRGATVGCIDLEWMSGRHWRPDADS